MLMRQALMIFKAVYAQAVSWLSSPLLPTCYKRPILAPRPMSPKWTSPDLLRVMPRSTCVRGAKPCKTQASRKY